ncbi:MAG: coproporphyrinogen-III oxidase family protein [Pararhodobacter sp.]
MFFGGGTPSLMDPGTVQAVIDAARGAWVPANDMEITLEANPTSVDFARFQDFAHAGVNRVSLGVQSLDDEALRLLGRRHNVNEALKAWDVANKAFDRVSLDLIYARQFQEAGGWRAELEQALALAPRHLSLYQLTVEDGTAFGDRHARGRLPGLPTEDRGADLWQMTQSLCAEAGLDAYEVSNHAESGQESLHNLVYWRYGDYIGIGPGAHGRLTEGAEKRATTAERAPLRWLAAIQDDGAAATEEVLTPAEQAAEMAMMGLRLSEGIDEGRYAALNGTEFQPEALKDLLALDLIWRENGRIGATAKGRPLLNSLLRALL